MRACSGRESWHARTVDSCCVVAPGVAKAAAAAAVVLVVDCGIVAKNKAVEEWKDTWPTVYSFVQYFMSYFSDCEVLCIDYCRAPSCRLQEKCVAQRMHDV